MNKEPDPQAFLPKPDHWLRTQEGADSAESPWKESSSEYKVQRSFECRKQKRQKCHYDSFLCHTQIIRRKPFFLVARVKSSLGFRGLKGNSRTKTSISPVIRRVTTTPVVKRWKGATRSSRVRTRLCLLLCMGFIWPRTWLSPSSYGKWT